MGDDITTNAGTANQSAKAANWNLTQGTSAGKTGTTGDYKSSAYLGFTPLFSAATVTWDYLTKPQSICMYPPNAPATATTKPLQLTGTCPLAVAKSSEGSKTSKNTGMTGGSVPAATWFDAMNKIQPDVTVLPAVGRDVRLRSARHRGAEPGRPRGGRGQGHGGREGLQVQLPDRQPAQLGAGELRDPTGPSRGQSALPGTAINVFVSAGSSTSGG